MRVKLPQPVALQKREPQLWNAQKIGVDYSAFSEGASGLNGLRIQKALYLQVRAFYTKAGKTCCAFVMVHHIGSFSCQIRRAVSNI